MKYSESNISKDILKGLAEMGFENMTPIQEMAIPALLEGRDIIGQAQTGTGKTAAFGIPMIEAMDPRSKHVQGLVLCPTRELAAQAAEEIRKMSKYVEGVNVVAIYGGQDIVRQFQKLKGKVSIVVGTPGRVIDHMDRGTLDFRNLKMLVLDEADEMLNMGFVEDIEEICEELPPLRQTALFSATMSPEIMAITQLYQNDAKLIKIEREELTVPLIEQMYSIVKLKEKETAICRLLDYMAPRRALIFCNTKRKVDELTLMLKAKGYSAEAIHGDLSQHQRERVLRLFKNGNLELLLATDVAARGIDVDDVEMVFNYDMPQDMEYYVHRIGRTGRAGKSGKSISIITSREKYKIDSLEDYCNTKIRKIDIPSAGSAMTQKAYRAIADSLEFCKDKDLNSYMKIVYKKCVEENVDPLYVAAALMRQTFGEIEYELGEESNKVKKELDKKKKKGSGKDGRKSGKKSDRRGDRKSDRKSDKKKDKKAGQKKERKNKGKPKKNRKVT